MASWFSAAAPVTRRVRAYFAPVDRRTQTPVSFDPAEGGGFNLNAPPAPWIDLGCIEAFTRKAGSRTAAVMTGIPAAALGQVRESVEAGVSFDFLSWTKLTMALATGSQHMNVMAAGTCAATVQSGSTATSLVLSASDARQFAAGQLVAVDADYTGQTGYVGEPIAGAFVRQALSDTDYVRRVTFNVARVAETSATGLTLAQALPGGAPANGAKVQAICGFVDREGGGFYQEWSGLFVMEGGLGERVFFHYPRLQACASAEETAMPLAVREKGKLARIALHARCLALPVTDALDGERVVCYRSFVPAANALV